MLKPTGMMTNSEHLRRELSRRCPGQHEHVQLMGGRAAAAQEYPVELCRSICKGIAAQKAADNSRMFSSLPMCTQRLSSLSSLCREASCEMSDKSSGWPGVVERPIGNVPDHWQDGIHDLDGHGMACSFENRDGETKLRDEINALMVKEGI